MEKIIEAVKGNKTLLKAIKKQFSWMYEENEAIDCFIESANDWIKSIEERRMLCVVKSVSRSGMSRNFYYLAYADTGYRSFFSFLSCLGYRMKGDCVVREGCGMDMNFDTNYSIIHKLFDLGFMDKERRNKLCQMTPNIV